MSEKKHTPTLQVAGQYPSATFVCSQGTTATADVIAKCDEGTHQQDHAANAARIVLTWNSHDALVEALWVARGHINMYALRISHCKDAAVIDAALKSSRGDL